MAGNDEFGRCKMMNTLNEPRRLLPMKAIGRLLAPAIVTAAILGAKAVAEERVPRQQAPPQVSAVRDLGGFVGQRIRANTVGYLNPFDIERYTKMVEDKKQRDWWWIGEQPGKWLESAVLASCQANDRSLEERGRTSSFEGGLLTRKRDA